MNDQQQISAEACEEICSQLLEETRGVTDKVFLWRQALARLAYRLGHESPILPPPDQNTPSTPENLIGTIRDEMYALLEGRTSNSRTCMKAFDRINDV